MHSLPDDLEGLLDDIPELQQPGTILTPLLLILVWLGWVRENLTVEVSEAGTKGAGDSKQNSKTGDIQLTMTLK